MCTAFVKRGDDVVFGYNLDLAEGAWDYRVYPKDDLFYIGIKVGSTVYKVHGVNRNGNFGNLPYMNAPGKGVYRRGKNVHRLDLLVDAYISGKRTFDEVLGIVREKDIVNVPNASMHSLLSDGRGRMLLVEPGLGYREISDGFAVVSNFSLLDPPSDFSPVWYGKDRYDTATAMLEKSGRGFSVSDGLELLHAARQEGEWATRVSFVYSRNENAVYYVQNNDFATVTRHAFRA